MKVVINKCYGGFGLSMKTQKRLGELLGYNDVTFYQIDHSKKHLRGEAFIYEYIKIEDISENIFCSCASKCDLGKTTDSETLDNNFFNPQIERYSSELIQIIEELGINANADCARLSIIEIPDGVDYEISEYDGFEHVAEKHRTWG
jgi:hypothetical protein